MKQIIISLLVICCALISCTPKDGNEAFEPYLQIRPEAVTFDADGGAENVQVLANFEYDILPSADWITVERGVDFYIKIVVAPSNLTTERKGQVLISNTLHNIAKVINVSQAAYIAPSNPYHPSKTIGWAEMPAKIEGANLEYCYHDKLPSNNKLRNYSFCFDKEKHCALWVAYPLHKCYTEGSGRRTDDWGYDPCCVEDKNEPNLFNAYYPKGGSSFSHSRGHQLPSADRLASNADNATTFYFTNMTPQLQALNGGTWENLESELRKKWICSDTLYIVTGAHFASGYGYAYDSKGNGKACAVPTHYYKVVLRTKSGNSGKWVKICNADELKCVGYWFEHKDGAARQTMSVAEIEKKTGITFFPNVPNAPKTIYKASDWQ